MLLDCSLRKSREHKLCVPRAPFCATSVLLRPTYVRPANMINTTFIIQMGVNGLFAKWMVMLKGEHGPIF